MRGAEALAASLCTCLCFISVIYAGDGPLIKTSQGALRGIYLESTQGRPFAAYMSIPYAEPPIGSLRFKAPIEAKSWTDIRDASQDSPHCIQNNPYIRSGEVSGTEDCLYLNVYTPKDSGVKAGALLPVMIFYHGGGWMCGSGNKLFYGPEHLLDRDVIYVGVNYRLSVLGLFSTMDQSAPGNWAFKDQNMAMRWVQKHIKNFGGDPDSVTLFGESAGAASTHYHIMSPASRGLFHKAVLHSGTALCVWANSSPGRIEKHATLLGKLMKCPTHDTKMMVECLRTKKAEDLVATDTYFYDWDFDPMIPFRPVIEPPNEDSFLSEDPRVLLSEGRFSKVPIMMGINQNEGAIRSAAISGVKGLLEELSEKFESLAPITFNYDTSPKANEITKIIKDYYLKDKSELTHDLMDNITDIYSDAIFTAGIDETIRLQLPESIAPIYFYHFTYRGKSSFSEVFGDPSRDFGACHVDELLYIFSIGLFPKLDKEDLKMSDTMLTIWTNFAKSGNPSKPNQESAMGKIPEWPPLASASEWLHMDIGNKLTIKPQLLEERRKLWQSLPLWQKYHSKVYTSSSRDEL